MEEAWLPLQELELRHETLWERVYPRRQTYKSLPPGGGKPKAQGQRSWEWPGYLGHKT